MLDRKTFFDSVRSAPFAGTLTPGQVEGMNAILDEAERRGTDKRWLAYMLATTFHETDRKMLPINEYGSAAYFNKRYGPNTSVGKTLGNTVPGDGNRFHGRGLVQLTGRANYLRAGNKIGVDLLADPDAALDLDNSVRIMFDGMASGWFTGKKLADYFNTLGGDYVNARRIINGTDKASLIAGYAQQFHSAIHRAAEAKPSPQPSPPPAADPSPPVIDAHPAGEARPEPPQMGFWARLVAFFARLFGS